MAEILYKDFKAYLKTIASPKHAFQIPPVYLIYGEELLCRSTFEKLLNFLVPASERNLRYEPITGDGNTIQQALAKLNTYSFIPGTKVIALVDSKIFYSKKDTHLILEKAKEAFDANDIEKSTGLVLNLLSLLNLNYTDFLIDALCQKINPEPMDFGDNSWLEKILSDCREKKLAIPPGADPSDLLRQAIEKGFPVDNHLIITADLTDKRKGLYRIISEKGAVINCSVPAGNRKADRMAQGEILSEQLQAILRRHDKIIDRQAYAALVDSTGFDLRTFTNNIEKLVDYVGEKKEITIDDIKFVVNRTKKDPIYELTSAVSDRDLALTLFYLGSLLADGIHPLQIIAAITNQIRKLLLIKDFTMSPRGKHWQPGISFENFKSRVMPAVKIYDDDLADLLRSWEQDSRPEKEKRRIKKSNPKTDLLIARNPNNPYPVYQTMQKAENFSRDDLLEAVFKLHTADLKLKSSPLNSKLVLEEVIFSICRKRANKRIFN